MAPSATVAAAAAAVVVLLTACAPSSASSPLTPRVVGGTVANSTLTRHLIYLQAFGVSQSSSCTGTMLTRDTVLTAWHCVAVSAATLDIDESALRVTIAPTRLPPSRFQRRYRVAAVYVPFVPRGSNDFLRVDIAVLRLSEEIAQSEYWPVRLGSQPRPGESIAVTGYGLQQSQPRVPARTPKQTTLKTLDISQCRRDAVPRFPLWLDRDFCAVPDGYPDVGGTGLCSGDSGGPAFVWRNARFEQFAVLSRGTSASCGAPGVINVYSRVDYLQPDLATIAAGQFNGDALLLRVNISVYETAPGPPGGRSNNVFFWPSMRPDFGDPLRSNEGLPQMIHLAAAAEAH